MCAVCLRRKFVECQVECVSQVKLVESQTNDRNQRQWLYISWIKHMTIRKLSPPTKVCKLVVLHVLEVQFHLHVSVNIEVEVCRRLQSLELVEVKVVSSEQETCKVLIIISVAKYRWLEWYQVCERQTSEESVRCIVNTNINVRHNLAVCLIGWVIVKSVHCGIVQILQSCADTERQLSVEFNSLAVSRTVAQRNMVSECELSTNIIELWCVVVVDVSTKTNVLSV